MSLGLVGRKVGMTRVFTDDGDSLPVTVLDVSDNRVTQIKTPDTDGYTRRAGDLRQAPRRPASASRWPATSPRPGSRAERSSGSSASARPRLANFQVGAQDRRRHLQGRAEGRRLRHLDRARASPASSSATTSPRTARATATRSRTASPARPARTRARAACSPASAWPGHLGAKSAHGAEPRRSCASTPSGSCCSSRARSRAPQGGHIVVQPAAKTPRKAAPAKK